jgi:hypothetical protein
MWEAYYNGVWLSDIWLKQECQGLAEDVNAVELIIQLN